jgi:hypothetical protein
MSGDPCAPKLVKTPLCGDEVVTVNDCSAVCASATVGPRDKANSMKSDSANFLVIDSVPDRLAASRRVTQPATRAQFPPARYI